MDFLFSLSGAPGAPLNARQFDTDSLGRDWVVDFLSFGTAPCGDAGKLRQPLEEEARNSTGCFYFKLVLF